MNTCLSSPDKQIDKTYDICFIQRDSVLLEDIWLEKLKGLSVLDAVEYSHLKQSPGVYMDVDFSRNGADPRERCLFLRPLMTSLNQLKVRLQTQTQLFHQFQVCYGYFGVPSCSLQDLTLEEKGKTQRILQDSAQLAY